MQYETIGFIGILFGIIARFWPVWAALAAVLFFSLAFKKRLGLYGQLYDGWAGMAGLVLCCFWLFTAIFANLIAPFEPLQQIAIMKDAPPGAVDPDTGAVFLLGADRLARDVFSRMVFGSQIVLVIAPAATLFALLVGTVLGLPAGYYGGGIDRFMSFLANLVLAFPVILLFYLLVTPGVRETPIPQTLAGLFLIFPVLFFCTLFWTRYSSRPGLVTLLLAATLLIGGWLYAGLVFNADPLRLISLAPNELNIFVAVVFASSPGVFRIVRGLTMEIRTRDYVAAAQTRGEAVETGKIRDVFERMRHPYTQGLLRAVPLPSADKNEHPLIAIPGQQPAPQERPRGCNFGPRCRHFRKGFCDAAEIPMVAIDGPAGHWSRCIRVGEIDWDAPPDIAAAAREPVAPGAPVLKFENVRKYYQEGGSLLAHESRLVKANETVSFDAREAETLAIVGESGSGKSTLAKMLVGLETATSGRITFHNAEIQDTPVEARDRKTVAGIQMVFQNPFDTLNPTQPVGSQIVRTLEKFRIGGTDGERRKRMLALLDLVKLPRSFANRMPRQLSGGQKQRVGIARAFAGNAKLVVADEPVSTLDVSVQAAVTDLLTDIQRRNRTTMLFISHDLSLVRYIADRVVVMYLGHIVEQGTTEQIFSPPYHPYTEALLSAVPIADTHARKRRIVLKGEIPSPIDPPSGCPFQTRCPYKHLVPDNLCERELPPFRDLGDGHRSLCWLGDEVLGKMEPVIQLADAPAPQ